MAELIRLPPPSRVLATIEKERGELAAIVSVAEASTVQRRAAAILELTRRGKLDVPIQNAAAVYAAEAMARLADLIDEGQAKGEIATQEAGRPGSVPAGDTSPAKLKDLGLSRQTLLKARAQRDAGVPKLLREQAAAEAAKAKPKRVSAAAALKEHKQAELRKQREAERKRAARAASRPFGDRCRLLVGDLLVAGAQIEDGSVDAIVTDPPYPAEYLPCWESLGSLAARVLKPGGWLVAMAAHAHLPQIMQRLDRDGLTYRWTLAYLMPSGESAQLRSLRLNVAWKPVLLYTSGTMKQIPTYGTDVLSNDVQDEDRHDAGWGQGVDGFAKLVAGVSRAEQTVLDPFLGTGTTALAALTRGRRFVGIDIDERYVNDTWHRLGQAQ